MDDHWTPRRPAQSTQKTCKRHETGHILAGIDGSHQGIVEVHGQSRDPLGLRIEQAAAAGNQVYVEAALREVPAEEQRDLLRPAELELCNDVNDRRLSHPSPRGALCRHPPVPERILHRRVLPRPVAADRQDPMALEVRASFG